MTVTFTPVATLEFVKARILSYFHEKEIDEDELLRLTSEAYTRLCEDSLCLREIVTLDDVANQTEYALPADHFRTIRVYRNGLRQPRLPDWAGLTGCESGYYEYDGYLGVQPTPELEGGQTWLLYARSPAALTSWLDELDPVFPAEFTYALVHHVHSRISTMIGGEGRIQQVTWHRQQYEKALITLRRRMTMVSTAKVNQLQSPFAFRPRGVKTVAPGTGIMIVQGGGGGAGSGSVGIGDLDFDPATQAELDAISQERAAYLGVGGTLSGTMTDAADFPFVVPFNATILRLKATLKTAPSTAMSVQLRSATDLSIPTYQNVSGWSLTFGIGEVGAVTNPGDLTVAENTLLNLSVANGSGTNLLVSVVLRPT